MERRRCRIVGVVGDDDDGRTPQPGITTNNPTVNQSGSSRRKSAPSVCTLPSREGPDLEPLVGRHAADVVVGGQEDDTHRDPAPDPSPHRPATGPAAAAMTPEAANAASTLSSSTGW